MQQAAENDHAPHAIIIFIQEDGEILSHYLKTQAELLKKKYSIVQ